MIVKKIAPVLQYFGDKAKAMTLKGKALAFFDHVLAGAGKNKSGMGSHVVNGSLIIVNYATNAFGQKTGVIKITSPVIQNENPFYAGFLFRYPLIGSPIDYYAKTSSIDGWMTVSETEFKGKLLYWHGKKETVSWYWRRFVGTYIYINGVEYLLDDIYFGIYAWKVGGKVLVMYHDATYIGIAVYGYSDELGLTTTSMYKKDNAFSNLKEVKNEDLIIINISYLTSVAASQNGLFLSIIGTDNSTPTSGYPVTIPGDASTAITAPFGVDNITRFSNWANLTNSSTENLPIAIPAQTINGNNWNTVFRYAVSLTQDDFDNDTVITQISRNDQFKKHIYLKTETVTATYNDVYTVVRSAGIKTWSSIYYDRWVEPSVITTVDNTLSGTTQIFFTALYNTPVKTKVWYSGNSEQFETMQSSFSGNFSESYQSQNQYHSGFKPIAGSANITDSFVSDPGGDLGIPDFSLSGNNNYYNTEVRTQLSNLELTNGLYSTKGNREQKWIFSLNFQENNPVTKTFSNDSETTDVEQNIVYGRYENSSFSYKHTGWNPYIKDLTSVQFKTLDDLSGSVGHRRTRTTSTIETQTKNTFDIDLPVASSYAMGTAGFAEFEDSSSSSSSTSSVSGVIPRCVYVNIVPGSPNPFPGGTTDYSTTPSPVNSTTKYVFMLPEIETEETSSVITNHADRTGCMIYILNNTAISPTQYQVKIYGRNFAGQSATKTAEIVAITPAVDNLIGLI